MARTRGRRFAGVALQLASFGLRRLAVRLDHAGRKLVTETGGSSRSLTAPRPPGAPLPLFDRAGATAWAVAHVDDPDTIVPDCAYFVSQALHLGGRLPATATWAPGLTHSRVRRWRRIVAHPAYGTAVDFVVEMQRAGYARLAGLDTAADVVPLAQPGDVLVYNWDGSGLYQHVALVTSVEDGVPRVTQHTPTQRRRQWNRYGNGDAIDTASLLHFLTDADGTPPRG